MEEWIERVRQGDAEAAERVIGALMEELHRIAHREMRNQPPGHTLQTTALVNEAWLRIARGRGEIQDRAHFLALAARAMRTVLIDSARKRLALKRGGNGRPVTLDEDAAAIATDPEFLVGMEESLSRLAEVDPELAAVAELRIFGGLSGDEVAEARGCSRRTGERAWRSARAWLQRDLRDG